MIPGFDDGIDTDDNGIPDDCEACLDNIAETTNSIIANDRSAGIGLSTNGRALSGLDIKYHAGQEINLLQGFEVPKNTVFRAIIEGCN